MGADALRRFMVRAWVFTARIAVHAAEEPRMGQAGANQRERRRLRGSLRYDQEMRADAQEFWDRFKRACAVQQHLV